jgi:hypothetical protein
MRRMLAEPKGAAAWGSMLLDEEWRSESLKGWAGRYGAKWDFLTSVSQREHTLQLDRHRDLLHHEEYRNYRQLIHKDVRLMQVEVTHISTKISRITQPNLRSVSL